MNLLTIRKLAKENKIAKWWTTPKQDLLDQLFKIYKVTNEAELKFILDGNQVKELPYSPDVYEAQRQEKKEQSKKPAKKVVKPTSEGIKLKDICEEVGVDPKLARRKLRASDLTKPAAGWVWTTDKEIEQVKAIIK